MLWHAGLVGLTIAHLHAGHECVSLPFPSPSSLTPLTADDILARYGLEMTWDMKAGLMGKGGCGRATV